MEIAINKVLTPYDVARRFIGFKEFPGSENSPLVSGMLINASKGVLRDDSVAWCAAFVWNVAWLFNLSRPEWPNSVRARQWLRYGKKLDMCDLTRGYDIVVLSRGTAIQPGPQILDAPGHVGFYSLIEGDHVHVLSGNQDNSINISPFPISRVLGFRRLF